MVNTEEFIRRLEVLFDYYSISASAFADAIGVQRSGLSHLLSGRNKPSLDFIMKIVEAYPEVDLYWLLNGKGSFPKETFIPLAPTPSQPIVKNMQQDLFSAGERAPETIRESTTNATTDAIKDFTGDIERIVIFYKNGTFINYTP